MLWNLATLSEAGPKLLWNAYLPICMFVSLTEQKSINNHWLHNVVKYFLDAEGWLLTEHIMIWCGHYGPFFDLCMLYLSAHRLVLKTMS